MLQVVHDFEHGGLTNDFLVNSLDNLAVRYNDRSPLENHHLAAAFTLMRHPDLDFVGNVPKGEFDKFRKVSTGCYLCLLASRLLPGSTAQCIQLHMTTVLRLLETQWWSSRFSHCR